MDNEPDVSDTVVWERLLTEQTTLFRNTTTRNKELETRVQDLERELSVWKAALKDSDNERKDLGKTINQLNNEISTFTDDIRLILCLIDGDGNIFGSEYITEGRDGGRQAAMRLTKGLTDNTTEKGAQVWLTIYFNKIGLLETLMGNGVCTAEQFEAFIAGFNQASPLFSIVDVGTGKEAADAKIKECLRVFTRFPQTVKVFFGGGHDNGYASTLNYLQNERLLHKIVFLRGYKQLAHELKSFDIPYIDLDIFMSKKLQSNPYKWISNNTTTIPTVKPQDFDVFRNKSSTTPALNVRKAYVPEYLKPIDPQLPLHKQIPPPCNFYYLAQCQNGTSCRFSHTYDLTTQQVEELRENAKKWPCPYINRGKPCLWGGDDCCMSHYCPKGNKCTFAKQGKCKFVGDHMHDKSSTSGNHKSVWSAPASKTGSPATPGSLQASPSLNPLADLGTPDNQSGS